MIAAILIGRKGSSGYPGKNTTLIAGHPMVWWPLQAALETSEIDRIYVSTDDPGIASIAGDMGAHLIDRPAYLGEGAYVRVHQVFRLNRMQWARRLTSTCSLWPMP